MDHIVTLLRHDIFILWSMYAIMRRDMEGKNEWLSCRLPCQLRPTLMVQKNTILKGDLLRKFKLMSICLSLAVGGSDSIAVNYMFDDEAEPNDCHEFEICDNERRVKCNSFECFTN